MDNLHLKEFSPDQELFAIIQNDGVLKIWDTETSILKQEYVPNLHLSSPCTALKWIKIALRKKRKSQGSEHVQGSYFILLGTNTGGLSLYSYTTAKIESVFSGDGHSKAITSIAHDGANTLYTTGLDSQVIKWNIKKCKQESSFKCGPEKPTAICLTENGQQIITASKTIKVWDSNSNELLYTLTGHSSDIIVLKSFECNEENFILSASKNDRNLSLWKISEKGSASGIFTLLNNSPNQFDYNVKDTHLNIVCICRNESLAYFTADLTKIKSSKTVKTKFTLEIASEDKSSAVKHIPVVCASISPWSGIIIGYGNSIMKFETIPSQQETKNTILVRKDPLKMKVAKKDVKDGVINEALNIVTPVTDQNTEVLNVISAKKRNQKPAEIPLGIRFENLTVGSGSSRPNAKKLTYQLIQGLHGNDANILRNVLRQTDEETVRLTVKYLPAQYVMSFVNELSLLMSKKTAGSEMALTWLRHLIQTHASSLMAYGHINLINTFGTTLGIIDHRTQNLPALMRLRGRLDLLVGQLKQNSDFDDEIHNENLLTYEDSDDESVNMDDKSETTNNEDIYDAFEDDDDEAGSDGEENDITMNGISKSNGKNSEGDSDEEEESEDDEEMDTS
ncbi:hypothetical protein PVAND_000832 [Polypedilum vanderplanki]|uniref:Small-subunit processome Utp12 domain-containing protein n=1 Tax=Polypedilum vanderplanki TaxID=319348 RepID=A0A9J6BL43_POLVA|nr:hypothetical protein PVAND_000832 [Polypedilum vanderplanki]